jgi:hypothetical protein
LLLLITAAVIFTALTTANRLEIRSALAFAMVALIAALLYVPVRQIAEGVINFLLRSSLTDPAEVTRRYSQEISGEVELPALVKAATQSINSLMRVRRSALIVVKESDSDEGQVELQMLPGDSKLGYLAKDGLLYRRFKSAFSTKHKCAPTRRFSSRMC